MQSNNQDLSLIDLAPYIRAIWKYKWLIIILPLISVTITLVLSLREKPSYIATAHIKIGKVWDLPVGDPNIIAELVTKSPFLLRVNEKLSKKRNIDVLSRAITAEKLEAGKGRARYVYLVRLTGRGASPELAEELTKATAEQVIFESNQIFDKAYTAYENREKELKKKIEELKTSATSTNLSPTELYEKRLETELLETELSETQINNQSPLKTFKTAFAQEIEPAKQVPSPNVYKFLAMAASTALALGVLIALALEFGWPFLKEAVRRN
ncbi:MAG: hypothetical protein HY819_16555 [Acidobacteria bacterium]|nr:hypothetical protein [Acidobacteriota bacterium]